LEFISDWSDETWALEELTRARTKAQYQITAVSDDSKTLVIDLYGVTLKTSNAGNKGQEYLPFEASGVATRVGTDLVSITLS
jgi:photosystem II stability/assembly factor-like uncharacterized protein